MQATRNHDQIVLVLGPFERQVFERILDSMLRHYRLDPGQIDPRIAKVWYSTRGCRTAGMSADETQEWLDALHEFKSANLKLLQSWANQVATAKGKTLKLELSLEHSAALLSVLNDHRLLLAARHDIGQAEMDLQSLEALEQLQPAQQFAIYEIHLLAWMMEEILRVTMPGAVEEGD